MNAYKKIFCFFSLALLSNSYSHAAYLNPWKISDEEIVKKVQDMGEPLFTRQAIFWAKVKKSFNDNKICDHRIRGYVSILEVLVDKILNKHVTYDGWKDVVRNTFEEYFNDSGSFFAYFLLRNMILSSELFNTLEKNDPPLKNGFKIFWQPIQDKFKFSSIHRISSFCEIIIFIKNLENFLLEKHKEFFEKEKQEICMLSKKDGAVKDGFWFDEYTNNITTENEVLSYLKGAWPKKLEDILWSEVCYKLIEHFCVNSSKFRELQGY